MSASYPGAVKSFPTYANGDQVVTGTINDPNLEITAIETGLLTGLAHDLIPDTTAAHRSLGLVGFQWYDLFISHNATIGGTLAVTGAMSTGALTPASLAVTGAATVGTTLGVTGDFSVATNKFTVAAASGNTVIAGTLGVTGAVALTADLAIATNKFTVSAASGNTLIAGTLTQTGDAAFAGNIALASGRLLYLDGGGDTMIDEASANVMRFRAGGVEAARMTALGLSVKTAILCDQQAGVSVSTSATTIYTGVQVSSADIGGMVIVTGTKTGDATIQFTDWLLWISNTSVSLVTGASKGAAASRSYTVSGLALQLAMGSSTYKISVLPVVAGVGA